ncbi:oxidoreductase [Flavobacterium sp. ZT3R18]|uniref:sialidase family protein n=1 Tax=Flavobacterium sp. ZT3R18 TaxID=2594429 RepID=UPI00117B462F|nr:oxidoreductase [Flavobacterium sp. ZT3R18]TRX37268.1 oxidoreductase [Flavobacterium sp. ZT3R18]
MRKIFITMLFLNALFFVEAQNQPKSKITPAVFNGVQVDTLFQDKISIRAIVLDNGKIWYAADQGRFGFYDLKSNKKFEKVIKKDTLNIEFRSIAKTSKFIYALNVANPALLYQISKDGKEVQLVYQENNKKVFYDSMQFWNDKEGIAVGDPIDDCLSVIVTRDGGNSWDKIPNSKLPKVFEGEAHFAASNTNVVIKGNDTWIVSGGKKSRVFYSSDKGNSWEAYETPIVQGKQMTGIFTADFYDKKNGFIAGGNYEVLNQNFENKAITNDGGKTWQLIAEKQGFGYASCVQYVPNSNGKGLVVIGASGLSYSSDGGVTWVQLLQDSSLFTIRFLDKNTAIAAGRNKMIRIRFK